jgi:deoxyribose-phosphate aldolase
MSERTIETARSAIACLDLTNLAEDCRSEDIVKLCARANGAFGSVAAVCIWPKFVAEAKPLLHGSSVRIATVINFPSGDNALDASLTEAAKALDDGADELDLVLPYRAFLEGEEAFPARVVADVARLTGGAKTLKVILETGALKQPDTIARASRLAIASGANFLKTSTGKIAISATPDAAEIMLSEIRAGGKPVGFKAAGGVKSVADAAVYFGIADRIMGSGWAKPSTFRFGASGLLDALIDAIEGRTSVAKAGY